MNSHMPGAPPIPPAIPSQSQSRRHQEYHQYQHQGPPRSPGPHNPYTTYPHPQHYYPHPGQMPYSYPRWPPLQPYPPPYPMHPPPPFPPRSPMIVSSQPHIAPVAPATRPTPYPVPPMAPQSPHHAPPTSGLPAANETISSPRDAEFAPAVPQPAERPPSVVAQPILQTTRMPFYPDLPWYSPPDSKHSFPPRATRRRKRRQNLRNANKVLDLPLRRAGKETESTFQKDAEAELERSETSTKAAPSEQETPATSQAPSETGATAISADTLAAEQRSSSLKISQTHAHMRKDTRTAIPFIPAVPQLPPYRSKQAAAAAAATATPLEKGTDTIQAVVTAQNSTPPSDPIGASTETEPSAVTAPTEAKPAQPKSWADLVRSKNAAATASPVTNGSTLVNGTGASRAVSLVEALRQFRVVNDNKVSFLKPRGLVNTGNMCYMNSILQILVSCIPFYDFLDQFGKRAAHSFKSNTPLVDAMIMFMREFSVIDSAESAGKLRLRLKDKELEEYGEPFIPEYVYDVIRRLPRFSSMRRGHQQDAEEFLGFLLAGLHDECILAMRSQDLDIPTLSPKQDATATHSPDAPRQGNAGWMEVGPKQKAAITRQSGDPSSNSPLTQIFGGALRSELRVPGLKTSVTLEPYQPLQLDIGATDVNNIKDALKGLTKSETLTGDFGSPRGPGTTATKQVFIESLPPVLILHLKRFQYDSSGGTQKIWKRVGYPLELEVPKEVFCPAKRGGLSIKGGLPRFRLTGVVYHHGKSAAGGHYTVDILRQDRREWIRVDDTVIRRIRPEDVAEGGAEEDPKVLARALERHKAAQESSKRNLFQGFESDDAHGDDGRLWSEVNGSDAKKKLLGSAGSNCPVTGKKTPKKESVKDNKVAYILLYERIAV